MNEQLFFRKFRDKVEEQIKSQVVSKGQTINDSSQVQELTEFINSLSKKDVTKFNQLEEKEDALRRLKSIYKNDFRHLYSEIFMCMIRLKKDIQEGSALYNLNTNMKVCYDYINSLEDDLADHEFKKKVFKLYDHIALEYARIAYWCYNEEAIYSKLTATEQRIDNMADQSEDIYSKLMATEQRIDNVSGQSETLLINVGNATKEAENLKSSQVTILGIFISIVVGLLGQIYVVGKGLSGEITSESLGLLLILIIVASVCTITAVVALLHIIARLIGRDILSTCSKSESCDTCNQCFCIVGRIRYRLPYLYGFYQVAIILLLLSVGIFYVLK